jgi:hypothetical protein
LSVLAELLLLSAATAVRLSAVAFFVFFAVAVAVVAVVSVAANIIL